MSNINTNIKVLREEARLSKEEFAEKMDINVETVILWEKGKLDPTEQEIKKMCPILRIHIDDFLERDILSERTDAGNRMKRSNTRSNYNWYLGNRLSMAFYISYLIIIPILFFLVFSIGKKYINNIVVEYELNYDELKMLPLLYAFIVGGFTSSIYIYIYLFKRNIIVFKVWYLLWISAIVPISIFVGAITLPIVYIYAFYKGIIRKGKNR